jgi:hypothetical protein
MAYVIQEDILASIGETINIKQGTSQKYYVKLHRDSLDNMLTADRASSITVTVVNRVGKKVLMFANPFIAGVTLPLNVGTQKTNDVGVISFEIDEAVSRFLEPGDLNIVISIRYTNFYPNAKTYILPLLKIGQILEGDSTDGGTGGGGTGGGGTTTPVLIGAPEFEIEHTDLSLPSKFGMMSIDSQDPGNLTEIIFRNLDKNRVRLATLENFLVNRMDGDKIEGIITLYSTTNPRFFTIFKILSWSRVDVTGGNGNTDNTDGIKLKVQIENVATGPGVGKELWQTGDKLTFSIDTHGIKGTDLKPSGILTFADKNKKVTKQTNGNGSATGVYITYSPYYDSYVMVEVNGISVEVGNNKMTAAVYFSGNNGISAVEIEAIRAGDQLIWNAGIAGFELELGDDINLIYEVDVDSLR